MRIGFDAKRAFFNTTGLGNYSRTLIADLAKYYPDNAYVLYSPQQHMPIGGPNFKLQGNMTLRYPKGLVQNLLKGSLWRSLSLGKHMAADKLEVYHGLSHELPLNIQKSQAKSVVTVHDLLFMRYPDLYPRFDRFMYHLKWKNACQKADRVIAISEQTKQDIIEFLGITANKSTVVHQSCAPIFYDYGDKMFLQHGFFVEQSYDIPYNVPDDYILYVGSITERKNLLHVVKAIEALQTKLDVHLVVVGSGDVYAETVQQYIANKGLTNNFTFLADVPTKNLPALYRCAKALVHPSIFEGFGLPIIEGLFSRIPVIASTGSCFAEAGGTHTLYVDPYDVAAMADAIEKVLTDGALRMDMILYGWEHAQQFHGQTVASKLMTVYQSLLTN